MKIRPSTFHIPRPDDEEQYLDELRNEPEPSVFQKRASPAAHKTYLESVGEPRPGTQDESWDYRASGRRSDADAYEFQSNNPVSLAEPFAEPSRGNHLPPAPIKAQGVVRMPKKPQPVEGCALPPEDDESSTSNQDTGIAHTQPSKQERLETEDEMKPSDLDHELWKLKTWVNSTKLVSAEEAGVSSSQQTHYVVPLSDAEASSSGHNAERPNRRMSEQERIELLQAVRYRTLKRAHKKPRDSRSGRDPAAQDTTDDTLYIDMI